MEGDDACLTRTVTQCGVATFSGSLLTPTQVCAYVSTIFAASQNISKLRTKFRSLTPAIDHATIEIMTPRHANISSLDPRESHRMNEISSTVSIAGNVGQVLNNRSKISRDEDEMARFGKKQQLNVSISS
jgi:hypothetical protein